MLSTYRRIRHTSPRHRLRASIRWRVPSRKTSPRWRDGSMQPRWALWPHHFVRRIHHIQHKSKTTTTETTTEPMIINILVINISHYFQVHMSKKKNSRVNLFYINAHQLYTYIQLSKAWGCQLPFQARVIVSTGGVRHSVRHWRGPGAARVRWHRDARRPYAAAPFASGKLVAFWWCMDFWNCNRNGLWTLQRQGLLLAATIGAYNDNTKCICDKKVASEDVITQTALMNLRVFALAYCFVYNVCT